MAFITYENTDVLAGPEHGKKRFNEMKLRHIADRLKLDQEGMSIDECILLGIEASQTCKAIGPFDPGYPRFVEEERVLLQLGEYLLVREEYKHLLPSKT